MTEPVTPVVPAPAAAPAAPAAVAAPVAGELAKMPEGLDPKFWNATTGKVNEPELLKEFSTLSAFKGAADAKLAEVPADMKDYPLALPDGFKLPEGVEMKVNEADPRLPILREHAKENGWTKAEFQHALALDAKIKIQDMQAEQVRVIGEQAKLGDKFPARREAMASYIKANLSKDEAASLEPVVTSASAFNAIEKLIAKANANAIPGNTPQPAPQPKQADVPMATRWYSPDKKVG